MATATPNGIRLLIVDDNDDNRDMLERRLRRRGYEVHAVASGTEALDAIDNTRFHAVLLDVMMPGLNGLEVLQYLRRSFSKEELPVLMATARADSEHVIEALRLGANDYLTKPINIQEVTAALDVALHNEDPADLVSERDFDESGPSS